jgi:hypothetical protein
MKKWYQHKEMRSNVTHNVIQINNTKIFITNDPLDGWAQSDAKQIDAWINVSDTPCNSLGALPWHCERYWSPVAEIHQWTYNHAFWIKNVLDDLVFNRKDIKKIVVHCHAGARRSPMSVFMWLTSVYGTKTAAKILWHGRPKVQKSRIENLNEGGHYGELCGDIENFYKICSLFPKQSLESILLKFGQITNKPLPISEQLKDVHKKKRTTRKEILNNLKRWYAGKLVIQKNSRIKLDVSDIICYSHLIPAEDFFRKNKCDFDKSYLYNWYLNQLMKRTSWTYPVIVNNQKDSIIHKNNLSVMELIELLKKTRYPKVTIEKQDYLVKIIG